MFFNSFYERVHRTESKLGQSVEMGTQDTAQALTILGIICNGYILFFPLALVFLGWLFMVMMYTLIPTLIWFVVGIILPIISYNEIPKGSRGSAGIILILSGIVSLIFIFLIGGILLIVAGAIVATSNPYPTSPTSYQRQWAHEPTSTRPSHQPHFHPLGPYHEYDDTSIWNRSEPSTGTSTAQTKKCVNCGAELERIDQYCHTCGTHVGWY